jgi:hypothetical protein
MVHTGALLLWLDQLQHVAQLTKWSAVFQSKLETYNRTSNTMTHL